MQDQDIIEQIRTGDNSKALDALYKSYPMVRKLVKQTGGNSQDAEDLFQEALIILCRKIREMEFVLNSKLSTFLFGVCRFLWKEQLTKRGKSPLQPQLTDLDQDQEQALEDFQKKEEQIQLAEKALRRLKDRCRELLILFYHKKLPLRKIASQMGYQSENVAKNQKYKCLETAKIHYQEMVLSTSTH